jgi:hypothetical protein
MLYFLEEKKPLGLASGASKQSVRTSRHQPLLRPSLTSAALALQLVQVQQPVR